MADGLFENLNSNSDLLNFLVGNSPEELLNQIKQIRLPTDILAIYAVGSRHICWFRTTAKIKKVKGKQNGNSSEV